MVVEDPDHNHVAALIVDSSDPCSAVDYPSWEAALVVPRKSSRSDCILRLLDFRTHGLVARGDLKGIVEHSVVDHSSVRSFVHNSVHNFADYLDVDADNWRQDTTSRLRFAIYPFVNNTVR